VEALQIVDLNTFDRPDAVQYPPGFPKHEKLNPSVRFVLPQLPKVIGREDI
jgi:hypothetical protein